jgi:hypothetical protein
MSPIYTFVQYSAMLQELANRLYDPTQQFWNPTELGFYITEALRTWNAFTGYWRGDFVWQPSQGVNFYDMTNPSVMPNTLRPYTVTDQTLYSIIQCHLLEPVAWDPWTGVSKQFTADDLLNAVQRRRDEVLSITDCTLTRSLVPAVNGRIALPDTVIDVRRMAYFPNPASLQKNSVMWPMDTWGEESFAPRYAQNSAGTPFGYLLTTEPPISFDTDRPPAYSGNYELLTVNAGPALSYSAASTLLVPDDFTWVIKWGALADLLSRESNAKDVPRAQYCEQMYRMGIKILSSAPALLAARIGNVPIQIDSLRAADLYNTGWEAAPQGPPTSVYHAGLNLIALGPAPDAGLYSATATVVQNAPVPINPIDYVQIGRDEYDIILDFAQHLAAFKQGGEEFTRSMALLQRFMKMAATYNGKLAEIAEFQTMLAGLSQRENQMNPISTVVAEGE